jgi:ubiquinone/menaquinone biosynthesis C-methylase UbiE
MTQILDEKLLIPLIKPGTKFLLEKFTKSHTTTLEVGCGPGQYRLAAKGLYFGVDITSQDYRAGLPRYVDALADARTLPFKDEIFDLIFFSNIFHYFENGSVILEDCYRLTKPGGRILIVDYSYPSLKYLQNAYIKTSPGFTACLHKGKDWLDLVSSSGYHNEDILINSNSFTSKLIKSLLPKKLFNKYLDTRELSIAVLGEK